MTLFQARAATRPKPLVAKASICLTIETGKSLWFLGTIIFLAIDDSCKKCENNLMFQPKFTITNQILKHIGAIEAAKEVIENAPLVPAYEIDFRQSALVRTVHHGTALEGNELSLQQAKRLVEVQGVNDNAQQAAEKADVTARERDIQEVINYRNVIDYLEKLGRETKDEEGIYKKTELKEIHRVTTQKILEEGRSGQYRLTQVVIRNSRTGEVTFRPPPAVEVPYQLDELFAWFNSAVAREVHSVLRAGIMHYELVRIHPFIDGNGRVARGMTLLVLFREGYDIKRFFSLEEYYDTHPAEYYGSLQSVATNNGEVTPWLEFFAEGLAVELNKIKEKVLSLSRDLQYKRELGGQVALTTRQIKLIEAMKANNGWITTGDAAAVFPMISRDTLLRDLHDLIKKGVAKKRGSTKASRYILTEFTRD